MVVVVYSCDVCLRMGGLVVGKAEALRVIVPSS